MFFIKNSKIDRFEQGTLYAFLSKTAKVDKFEKGNPYAFISKKKIFPEMLAKSKFFEKPAAGAEFQGYFKIIFKNSLNPPPSKVHKLGEEGGLSVLYPDLQVFTLMDSTTCTLYLQGELKSSPPQAPILGCILKFFEGGALKKISDAKDTPPPFESMKKSEKGGGILSDIVGCSFFQI